MSLFDVLSDQDKEKIEKYITACNFNATLKAPLETILTNWSKNKSFLYNLLGRQLIVEKPFTFTKTVKNMIAEFEKGLQCNTMLSKTLFAFERYLGNNTYVYYKDELIGKLGDMYTYEISMNADALFTNYKYLVTNSLTFDCNSRVEETAKGKTFVVHLPDKKTISVQKGMHTMKLLSKIAAAAEVSKEDFEDFRIFQSIITNQKEVSGTLCLSIHPLDYMTLSDNNNSWTSCMSWIRHGCYCQGSVEMLNSPCVLVGYIKDDKEAELNGVHWNSKKWRQLFIVDKDFTCGIKGYPYSNHDVEDACLNMIRECALESKTAFYEEEIGYIFLDEDEYEVTWPKGKEKALYLSPTTDIMYNDFGTGFYHHCLMDSESVVERDHYHDTTVYQLKKGIYYNYSGISQCMFCGGELELEYEDDFDSLICDDCNDIIKCAECGKMLALDNCIEINGRCYCAHCVEEAEYKSFFTLEELNSIEYPTNYGIEIYIDNDKDCRTWSSRIGLIYYNKIEGNPCDYVEGNDKGNEALFKEGSISKKWSSALIIALNYDELTPLGQQRLLEVNIL